MVRTEALKYIQLLHERGEGSLKISKRLGLSRNTVRKYLALLDSGQPIVLRVQRARALDPYEEVIKSLFIDCRGHCPNLQRRLKEQLGLAVQLAAHAAKVLSALAQNRAHTAGTRGTL